ncbi:hypothetical protein Deipe_2366 [Deinococcus peraridilitoris DSM 19664]|uniref:Uncharacterized protein n=1 Tax=Deinococcus peraridilitoris (strain DSM 19664 / LMG 22246 / CIP 109416 / KR-200) TaxID=937777 RepID=L0A323_DEIPD|nr:hypothetical protein Deipe_2366 [Deinococcus peraridilitoris DSM 19664]
MTLTTVMNHPHALFGQGSFVRRQPVLRLLGVNVPRVRRAITCAAHQRFALK